jgi:hypothetical protein
MKTLFGLSLLLLSTSAFAMSGTLEVKTGSLRVQRVDDKMKVHFYPGRYKTDITFQDRKAYVKIERKDILTYAEMALPAGTEIPDNGEIFIDGAKAGQTFSIRGTSATVRDDSAKQRGHESCVYYRREWVCHGHRRHRYCDWETVPVHGEQEVEYFFRTTTRTLALGLDSNTGGVADFNGKSTDKDKIYTHKGDCY